MEIETHPFEPWLPSNAKLLMLGTFPPAPKRWAMEWYYPNYTNDMWRIFGLAFFEDKMHFIDEANKTYKLQELKQFLKEKGVAIFDTALRIRRTTGTASDKVLRSLPECKSILAAGQLATKVFTEHYNIDARKMKMGEYRTFSFEGRTLKLYREPSSSRAYPMRVEEKATYYKQMFKETHIL